MSRAFYLVFSTFLHTFSFIANNVFTLQPLKSSDLIVYLRIRFWRHNVLPTFYPKRTAQPRSYRSLKINFRSCYVYHLAFVSPNSFSIIQCPLKIEYNLGGEVNHLSSDKVQQRKKEPDQDKKKRKQYIPTV